MKIELHQITIRDIFKGYTNSDEEGVIGFDGKLNIRPKFQREFVYNNKQRELVIKSVMQGFPLNTMYWVINKDNSFDVLDGQQRTISICEYVQGNYSIKKNNESELSRDFYFHSLSPKERQQILDYKLMIYFCDGDEDEKLKWFKIVNLAGAVLTPQELKNAVYTGPWLSDAKILFSKKNCVAYNLGNKYMKGTPDRQEYLETVIKWISNDEISKYMSKNQFKNDAKELWTYFEKVILWVKNTFSTYRSIMKGLEWGYYYNKYSKNIYDSKKLEKRIRELILDDDVSRNAGIYEYLLDGDENHLSIRSFTPSQKLKKYEEQKGICCICKKKFKLKDMDGDHIIPWSKGGKTTLENCQMLCKRCNNLKSNN